MTLPSQAFGFYPVARKLNQAFMADLPTNTLKKCRQFDRHLRSGFGGSTTCALAYTRGC